MKTTNLRKGVRNRKLHINKHLNATEVIHFKSLQAGGTHSLAPPILSSTVLSPAGSRSSPSLAAAWGDNCNFIYAQNRIYVHLNREQYA